MRTYLQIFTVFILLGGLCACSSPEDELFQEVEPAQKQPEAVVYPSSDTSKSQTAAANARARSIVQGWLLPEQILWEFAAAQEDNRLAEYLNLQGNTFKESARSANAQRVIKKTQKALTQLKREMVTSLRGSDSADDASKRLTELASRYSDRLKQLAKEEQATEWVLPQQGGNLRVSRQDLKQAAQRLFTQIQQDYGSTCAKKAKPVIDKAADDYWLAVSSLQTPEVISQALQQAGQEATQSFNKIIKEYGDPMISLSEEDISSMRVRLINAHQDVEKQFESLYGKEAVLQTRDIFEPYLKGIDASLKQPERLQVKQKKLEELGETYRQQMTALQSRLNESFDLTVGAGKETSSDR